MIIDSHVHLWDLSDDGYRWLGPEHGLLNRSYTAEQAGGVLAEAGVGLGILVQADDTAEDTAAMLANARNHEWIAGVVAWAPLDDETRSHATLEVLAADPLVCGIRHLVHEDPRDFLRIPAVRRSLARAGELGLPFDVPDAWPRSLESTVELAQALPGLTVVLDHLGKPPLGHGSTSDEFRRWKQLIGALAALPNTFAKVSGLHLPNVPYTAEALHPLWDIAMESFGPERLMLGGDWPVSLLGADYSRTMGVLRSLADELTPSERSSVESGSAALAYGIPLA